MVPFAYTPKLASLYTSGLTNALLSDQQSVGSQTFRTAKAEGENHGETSPSKVHRARESKASTSPQSSESGNETSSSFAVQSGSVRVEPSSSAIQSGTSPTIVSTQSPRRSRRASAWRLARRRVRRRRASDHAEARNGRCRHGAGADERDGAESTVCRTSVGCGGCRRIRLAQVCAKVFEDGDGGRVRGSDQCWFGSDTNRAVPCRGAASSRIDERYAAIDRQPGRHVRVSASIGGTVRHVRVSAGSRTTRYANERLASHGKRNAIVGCG